MKGWKNRRQLRCDKIQTETSCCILFQWWWADEERICTEHISRRNSLQRHNRACNFLFMEPCHTYIYIAILCHCKAPSVLTTAYTYSYSLHFIICIGDLNSLGNHAAYEFYRLQFPPYPLEELERVEWDHTMVNFLLMPLATRKQFFTEALMEIQQQGIHRTQQKSKNYWGLFSMVTYLAYFLLWSDGLETEKINELLSP